MSVVLELTGIVHNYHAIRPLRIEKLSLAAGEHVAVLGFDAHSAEVLINLMTGAVLPESGEITAFGRPTSSLTDSKDWLDLVDRFGILSERAVLMEPMTVIQNLAMPFSLDIEPPAPELRARAETLAREVGLEHGQFDRRLGDLDPGARLRVRLGRALAFDPSIVVLEHSSATLSRGDVVPFAREIHRILQRRRSGDAPVASLALTADAEFAAAVSARTLVLDPASGRVTSPKRSWFGPGIRSL